jgi:hypothetical protein
MFKRGSVSAAPKPGDDQFGGKRGAAAFSCPYVISLLFLNIYERRLLEFERADAWPSYKLLSLLRLPAKKSVVYCRFRAYLARFMEIPEGRLNCHRFGIRATLTSRGPKAEFI